MRSLQYRDDENGGVEAECELQMSLNGIGMHVKLPLGSAEKPVVYRI